MHRLPLIRLSVPSLPRVSQEVKNAELPDHIADPGGDGGDSDKFDALITWLQTPVGAGGREAQVSEFPLLYMKRYSENNRGVHCRVDIGVSWAAAGGDVTAQSTVVVLNVLVTRVSLLSSHRLASKF